MRFGLKLFSIILLLVYTYACLVLLQLALFNLIMLGVMCIYFKKLYYFLHGFELKKDHNYRNADFKKFIEAENSRYYRQLNVELIPGEQGKWLELQLPDDIDDLQQKERASKRVKEMIEERADEEGKMEDELSGVEDNLE